MADSTPGPGAYLPQDWNSSFKVRPSSAPRSRTPVRALPHRMPGGFLDEFLLSPSGDGAPGSSGASAAAGAGDRRSSSPSVLRSPSRCSTDRSVSSTRDMYSQPHRPRGISFLFLRVPICSLTSFSLAAAETPGPGAYNLLTPPVPKYLGKPVFMGASARFSSVVPLTAEDSKPRRYAPPPSEVCVLCCFVFCFVSLFCVCWWVWYDRIEGDCGRVLCALAQSFKNRSRFLCYAVLPIPC